LAGAGGRRIIEPVRQFVRADSVRMVDAERYPLACGWTILAEVTEAVRLVEGVDQAVGLARLHELMPDIRRTVIWGAEHGQPALISRVLGALRAWWWASGLYGDGQMLYGIGAPVIDRWRPSSPEEHGWRLAALAARIGTKPGFAPAASYAASLDRWLAEAHRLGAPPAVRSWIAQLLSCGLTFMNQEPGRAEVFAVAAIEDAHAAGDPWLAAWGRYALSLARARTDPTAALALFEQTIEAFAPSAIVSAARSRCSSDAEVASSVIHEDPKQAFAQAEAWCAELGAAPVRVSIASSVGRRASMRPAMRLGRRSDIAIIPKLSALGDLRCAAVAERSLASLMASAGSLDGASALVAHAMETFRSLEIEDTEFALRSSSERRSPKREQWTSRPPAGSGPTMSTGSGVPMELRPRSHRDAPSAATESTGWRQPRGPGAPRARIASYEIRFPEPTVDRHAQSPVQRRRLTGSWFRRRAYLGLARSVIYPAAWR
jgi:hypothetical protein